MLKTFGSMCYGTLGAINAVRYHIYLVLNARAVMSRFCRAVPAARKEIDRDVQHMRDKEIIEPAQCLWDSPVVLAPKDNGSWRFCIAYRHLDALTICDTYPMPSMDDYINYLGEATIFTALDGN